MSNFVFPCKLFHIAKFPFICTNFPAAPAYGEYISQFIPYSRACGSYDNSVAANKAANKPRVLSGYVKVINVTIANMTWLTVMKSLCHK